LWCVVLVALCRTEAAAQVFDPVPQTLFTFEAEALGDLLGHSVSGGGDVDADGRPDVIVGAPGTDPGGLINAGSVFVHSGRTGELLWRFDGADTQDTLGTSVADAGDIDGDGHDDVLAGASNASPLGVGSPGSLYAFSGRTGEELWRFDGEGSQGIGYACAAAGDVDGDGRPDAIVAGRPSLDTRVVVLSGATGGILHEFSSDSGVIQGEPAIVGGAGDIDGDGRADLIVGSPGSSPGGVNKAGVATVYSGATGDVLLEFVGPGGQGNLGQAVAGAGDVDADGVPDLIVGAPQLDLMNPGAGPFAAGTAFVYSGQTGLPLWVLGGEAIDHNFGRSVDGAGDVDGDGHADLIVGGPEYDLPMAGEEGSAQVFSGKTGELIWTFVGEASNSWMGVAVAGVGDVDGNGFDDVVAGMSWFQSPGHVSKAFVWGSSAPPLPTSLAGNQPGSLGIFPIHRSGGGGLAGGSGPFFTILSVTNTNLQPQTPLGFGGSTNVHYQYVNVVPSPTDPFIPSGCVLFDRVEFLTPGDTLSVLTSCHNAATPGGQKGYVVISAQDPVQFGVEWSFDHLIGSELVVNASGGIFGLEMVALQSPVPDGAPTDVAGDGDLDFDGVEYSALPDELYVDSFLALAGSRLTLLNLTGGPDVRNTVQLLAWNDNEFPLSATRTFACWFDEPLSTVSPLFTEEFLANNTPDDPTEVDLNCNGEGTLETAWIKLDSIGLHLPGGAPLIDAAGNPVTDGALLGAITAGPGSLIDGGRLLWESTATQANGGFNGH
jgi:hypothetical protein